MNIYTPLEGGLGDWVDDAKVTSFEDADIVLIPGGSDVNPKRYGHTALHSTYIDNVADEREMNLINKAIKASKFIVGICKGSQMLTAKAGGWLIQDVNGHHSNHEVTTHDGKTFVVNSSHHQMCYPYDLPDEDYKLLAWTGESNKYIVQGNKSLVDVYGFKGSDNTGRFMEPEIIWYPKIRGLAIQSHPEWASMPIEFNKWLNKIISEDII